MTPHWQISIRSKILVVLSTVVILAVAFYLYLASRIFYEDKTLLIYELNQTNVQTLGSDVEIYLKRVLDKLQIIAALSSGSRQELNRILPIVAGDDEGFLRVGIGNQVLATWTKPLQVYAEGFKDSSFLDSLRKSAPIPVEKVIRDGAWVRNVTPTIGSPVDPAQEGPPIMTVAARFTDQSGVRRIIYVDLLLEPLAKVFSGEGIAKTYLVDSEGFTLVHSGGGTSAREDRKSDPLLKAAYSSKVRSEVRKFKVGENSFLGSFFKVNAAGVVVGSEINSDEAFTAARLLVRKSLLYALIVITAAFLVSLFLSQSLTEPIEKLVEATRRIALGDFSLTVPVSSHDELSVLAGSFNKMTEDLKSSREQIQEYSRTLERKVADRTAKLEAQTIAIQKTQDALVKTTRLASVGEVAGRAAHEVLNPLTNITARLEKIKSQDLGRDNQDWALIKEIAAAWSKAFAKGGAQELVTALSQPSTAEKGKTLFEEDLGNLVGVADDSVSNTTSRKTDIDFLLKECGRISKIVNGMRQLTRVSGHRRRVNTHELLDEALSSMGDLFEKNTIAVEKIYCPENPVLFADHDELLQVLSNLFRNSIQSMRGSGKLWIKTSRANGRISIRVCDNGPGVAIENHHQVFEPTFTTKSIEEGTGLGLSIARRFIRAHEGDITLEKSEPGRETVFLIDLPEASEKSKAQYVG